METKMNAIDLLNKISEELSNDAQEERDFKSIHYKDVMPHPGDKIFSTANELEYFSWVLFAAAQKLKELNMEVLI